MQRKFTTSAAFAAFMALLASAPAHAKPDWSAVGQALGKSGAEQPGGVYRVALPRSDLKVTLDGVGIKPALALGSWLAFQAIGDDAMVMGDLVLTQDEVNQMMKRLAEGGIEITALHNHLLRAEPATLYMHVDGHGDAVKLAETVHAALALSKTPFAQTSAAAAAQTVDLDTPMLDKTLGHEGKAHGGVYQFTIPRAETITDRGMAIPVSMGTAIAINFQPTGSGKAAITGDFGLIASEVNPVLRALRENGIEVTAVHNHMLDDQPHPFFMHFWANDDAAKLAHGLRGRSTSSTSQRARRDPCALSARCWCSSR
jgi:hypothetical protein